MKMKKYKVTFGYLVDYEMIYISLFIDRRNDKIAIENARFFIAQSLSIPYYNLKCIDICEV